MTSKTIGRIHPTTSTSSTSGKSSQGDRSAVSRQKWKSWASFRLTQLLPDGSAEILHSLSKQARSMAEQSWLSITKFNNVLSLTSGRCLMGSIKDWPALYRQAFDRTKPGGWIQHLDMSIMFTSDDGSVADDHVMPRWSQTFIDVGENIGKTFLITSKASQWIRDAGYEAVEEKWFKVPVGSWPKDKVRLNYFLIFPPSEKTEETLVDGDMPAREPARCYMPSNELDISPYRAPLPVKATSTAWRSSIKATFSPLPFSCHGHFRLARPSRIFDAHSLSFCSRIRPCADHARHSAPQNCRFLELSLLPFWRRGVGALPADCCAWLVHRGLSGVHRSVQERAQ